MLQFAATTGTSFLLAIGSFLTPAGAPGNAQARAALAAIPYIDASEDFEPTEGAIFVADTQADIGYLINPDGRFRKDLIGSGPRRVIRYMGRTYFGATPEDHWVVLSNEKKGNYAIFDSGPFLRMYQDGGEERTAYGIHSSGNIDWILTQQDRKKSMGCILVRRDMRALLVQAFHQNGNRLHVITVNGIGKWNPSFAAVAEDSLKTWEMLGALEGKLGKMES